MKSYTDIEQSKILSKILSTESADMVHFGIHQGMDGKYYLSGTNTEDDVVPIYKNICTKVFVKATESDITCQLPCWSISALLSVLPQSVRLVGTPKDSYWYCEYDNGNNQWRADFKSADNPIDACVAMIEHLHELNLL